MIRPTLVGLVTSPTGAPLLCRYSSLERSFDATGGETISFQCDGAMLWPRWVASFAVPRLGISLKRR